MTLDLKGSGRLKIEFAQASDPGRDPNKQVNEDSCGYAETRFGHLCVLCDGMGGHYGGKEASRTAITTIFEVIEQISLATPPSHALKQSIEEAGRRVYRLGGPPENRTRPGSTVVALLLHDRGLDVAHVGDSRAYIIRSNQIYPLTRDHSMVQGMIDAGMLTEESAMGHPDSNKITRALGMKPEVDVEIRPDTMELFSGDVLMQSSDGLTDLALGREILGATRQALASGGVEHACQMLVKMANDRGGHDNITVQMVRVAEVSAKTGQTIPERPAPQPAADVAAHAAPGPTPAMTPLPGAVSSPNQNGPPSLGRPAGSVPIETMHMASSPMAGLMANPSYVGNKSLAQVAAAAGQAPGQGWAAPQQLELPPPSLPQPAAPAFGPPPGHAHAPASPTLSEQQAPPSQAWGALPPVAPGSPPQNLAPYRADGPNALPLPPPSLRPLTPSPGPYGGGVPPTGPMVMPGPPPTVPMQVPVPGSPGAMNAGAMNAGAMAAGFGAPAPTPGAIPGPVAAPPSRGGLVFLIIGFSAVIAVLIVVILILALK